MAHVLLVEDSPTQAVMLESLLKEHSHTVTVARDGSIAFELISVEKPGIVVTDMQMPNMNGLELVQEIRQKFPNLPVILITAQGSEELSNRALEEGAAAYLLKSLVDEELLQTIDHVIDLMDSAVEYDDLFEGLQYHEFSFEIDNDPSRVGPLVNFLQQIAVGMQNCDEVVKSRIGMAVEQALLNAIYHGNLEISHEEQQQDEEFVVDGDASLVERKRKESPFSERRVHFVAHIANDEMVFRVRDEGQGFDTSDFLATLDNRIAESGSGKGLLLIQSFMDRVTFNETGNEITMRKSVRNN